MRVLHIVPLISDAAEYGGPVRGTLRQSVATQDLGHSATVLALWRGSDAPPSEMWGIQVVARRFLRVPIHRLGGGISITALWWLIWRSTSFDVVHVHAGRDLWVVLAMFILRLRKIPYVWQTHGMLNLRKSFAIKSYDAVLVRPAMRGAAAMFYLTPFEKRSLEAFKETDRLQLLINGVDAPDASPPQLKPSPLKVVFCARLHERKRAIDLVRAVINLRQSGEQVELTLYGPDEGALPEILELIRLSGHASYVRYGGALAYELVRPALREYNVCVLPSVNEPFPNSVLEGLASGLAVVCTSSCGLAPYLRGSEAGIVIEPGVENIRTALESLIRRDGLIEQYGERGLQLARSTFSMRAVATSLEESYERTAELSARLDAT